MSMTKFFIIYFGLMLVGCGGGNNSRDDFNPNLPGHGIPPKENPTVNITLISGWGSSSMEMLANPMRDQLHSRFSVNYYNEGHSGEYSHHIAARLGAIPLNVMLQDTLENRDNLVLKAIDFPSPRLFKTFRGTLEGKLGEISPQSDLLVFKTTAQLPSLLSNVSVTFIPDTKAFKNSPIIVWSGKNDIIQKLPTQNIVTNTQAMCDWLTFKNYCLVVGLFSNSSWTKERTEMIEMDKVNHAYQNLFGANYLDIQTYLMSSQVWIDTGIVPTQQDLIQQQNGIKPKSLSIDDFHLNQKTMLAISKKIADRMVELGWYKDLN